MGKLKERIYPVHFYEIDYKKRIMPATIINYLQDIAIAQSEELGMGIDFLAENDLAWSLIQWDIHITQYPVLGQELRVSTRPLAFEKIHAYREFWIQGPQGESMAYALSLWILKDTAKKRITKIPEFMFENYGVDPDAVLKGRIIKLKEITRVDAEKEFLVRYSDIDTNRHVNNVKYLEWAVETMPLDTVINYVLRKMTIHYKKATFIGDEVNVMTQINEADGEITGIHKIENKEGQIVCLLETLWLKGEKL